MVDGRVVESMPANATHGYVEDNAHRALGNYVTDHGLGKLFPNVGFILARKPDVVRGPDLAFVSAQHLKAKPPPPRGFWETAPDLVIEVVSPEDTADEIAQKVGQYLESGVKLIWVIYPLRHQVHVVREDRAARILRGDDVIDGEDVVPGFSLPLPNLWK